MGLSLPSEGSETRDKEDPSRSWYQAEISDTVSMGTGQGARRMCGGLMDRRKGHVDGPGLIVPIAVAALELFTVDGGKSTISIA